MVNVKIILLTKKQKQRKDGSYPVVLRVTHQNSRNYLSLSKTSKPAQWNDDTSQFRRNYPSYQAENDLLLAVKSNANNIIRDFRTDGVPFSYLKFKDKFLNKNSPVALYGFIKSLIQSYKDEGKNGTASTYTSTMNALKKFNNEKKLLFNDINYTFLIRFEKWLRTERKCKDTSISMYMRTLKAVLNKAIKAGHMKQNNYPFKEYTTSHLKTDTAKRAIPKAKVKLIESLPFADGSQLQFAQNIFLFSYYTRGMNFADVANLTTDNIKGERLTYIRAKTGKVFNLAIHEKAKNIIACYANSGDANSGDGATDFIFPVFNDTHKTDKQRYNRRKKVLKQINKNLKQIAVMIGMGNLKLTSYVSRHTYATVLKKSGASVALISEALGHSDTKTTQVYLKKFENEELDKADLDIL